MTSKSSESGAGARARASRQNGARSHGPISAAGKARAARNALKHGLRARRLVLLDDEDAAEFAALEAALRAELAPDGALQTDLVARIASAVWRARRADRLEAALLGRHLADQPADSRSALGQGLIRDGHGPRALETLLRYRGAVLAELFRALAALKALQAEAQAAVGAGRGGTPLAAHLHTLPAPADNTKRTREDAKDQRLEP